MRARLSRTIELVGVVTRGCCLLGTVCVCGQPGTVCAWSQRQNVGVVTRVYVLWYK